MRTFQYFDNFMMPVLVSVATTSVNWINRNENSKVRICFCVIRSKAEDQTKFSSYKVWDWNFLSYQLARDQLRQRRLASGEVFCKKEVSINFFSNCFTIGSKVESCRENRIVKTFFFELTRINAALECINHFCFRFLKQSKTNSFEQLFYNFDLNSRSSIWSMKFKDDDRRKTNEFWWANSLEYKDFLNQ